MRKSLIPLSIVLLSFGVSTACASKGFVRSRVGEVNEKVETLSTQVEETQERVRQNEAKISDVDQRAQAAASAANTRAQEARSAASAVNTRVDTVDARVTEVDRATRRLIYEVVLSEDKARFAFGTVELPDEAKTELDRLVEQLKADPKGYYIEIEGHTDSTGPDVINERIGMERAESVKRYLYEQHSVPLHKMNVISYGEEKPVAPNNTRDGRSQNRRVVVKVLA